MKLPRLSFSFASAFLLGASALFGQSCAAVAPLNQASANAGASIAHGSMAAGNSVVAAGKITSGVVAVPLWMSGAVAVGSGKAVAAIGDSTAHSGEAATEGANRLWDFSSGEATQRPALDRTRGVPPVVRAEPRAPDPAPADMKSKL